MEERSFLIIKPDGIPHEEQILAILEPFADILDCRSFSRAPMRRMAALYREHRQKQFYPWLMTYFRGKPIKVFILGRKETLSPGNLHRTVAGLVGDTNPRQASPGTIRSLSEDDLEVSMSEGRTVRNLVHRSLTQEESQREGAIFFYDRMSPSATGISRGDVALELVNPLNRESEEGNIRGIFFEERLAEILTKMSVLPPGSWLLEYRESTQANGRGMAVVLEVAFLDGRGEFYRKEVPVEISHTEPPGGEETRE